MATRTPMSRTTRAKIDQRVALESRCHLETRCPDGAGRARAIRFPSIAARSSIVTEAWLTVGLYADSVTLRGARRNFLYSTAMSSMEAVGRCEVHDVSRWTCPIP